MLTTRQRAALTLASCVTAVMAMTGGAAATTPAAPAISHVTPPAGPTAAGAPVTVSGSGLGAARLVLFGGVPGTRVHAVSDHTVSVIAPSHAVGTVDVRVVTAAGTSRASAADRYTYVARPVVSRVSPDTGSDLGGTSVLLSGAGFYAPVVVRFAGTPAIGVTRLSASLLRVVAPRHTTGTTAVTVTSRFGTSATTVVARFTFRDAVPPSPVSSLKGAAGGPASVRLTWRAPADPDFSGVVIRRSNGGAPPAGSTDGDLVATTTSPLPAEYVDTAVSPNRQYAYSVFSRDRGGNVSTKHASVLVATPDTAPPGPVTNAAASATSQSTATLTWTDPTDASFALLLVCRTPGIATNVALDTCPASWSVAPGTASYQDSGLTPSTTYTYTFFAEDDRGRYTYGVYVNLTTPPADTTPPQQVGDVHAVALSPLAVRVTWTDPADPDLAAVRVTIWDGAVAGSDPNGAGGLATTVTDGSTSFVWAGADPRSTYSFRVFSIDRQNNVASPGVAASTTTPGYSTPTAPSAATAQYTASRASLQWTVSPTAGVDRYLVRRRVGTEAPDSPTDGDLVREGYQSVFDISADPRSTPVDTTARGEAVDGGLQPATTYSYAIFARNPDGVFSPPATVTVTTDPAAPISSPVRWDDPQRPLTQLAGSLAMSCPTATFCLAAAATGAYLVRDVSGWGDVRALPAPVRVRAVSCVSATFCTAVGDQQALRWNGDGWSAPVTVDPSGDLSTVSCVSTTFCVAFDENGTAFQYNGATWSTGVPVGHTDDISSETLDDPAPIGHVACVDSSLCLTADQESFDGTDWTGSAGGSAFDQIACVSRSFCLAVRSTGETFSYDGSSWRLNSRLDVASSSGFVNSLSCPSTTYCVAGTDTGVWVYSVYSGWARSTTIDTGFRPTTVSCPVSGPCQTISERSAGRGTEYWAGVVDPSSSVPTTQGLIARADQAAGAACADTTFCIAVDDLGGVTRFDGTTWGPRTVIDTVGRPTAVTCSSVRTCVVVDDGGNATVFDGQSWGRPELIDPGRALTAVSCPSAEFCLAVDGDNTDARAVVLRDGTWGPPSPTGTSDLRDVSCASSTYCAALGSRLVVYDGAAWTTTSTSGSSVSCVADTTHCVLAQGGGFQDQVAYLDGTTVSGNHPIGYYRFQQDQTFDPGTTSCTSADFCVVGEANAQYGALTQIDHATSGSPAFVPGFSGVTTVSCAATGTATLCAAVDNNTGAVVIGRAQVS